MSRLIPHLIVVPIVLPLVAAAVLLLLGERRRHLESLVNVAATLAGPTVIVSWAKTVLSEVAVALLRSIEPAYVCV